MAELLWPPWRGPKQLLNVGPWGRKIDKHIYSKFRNTNKEPSVLHFDLTCQQSRNDINNNGNIGIVKPLRLLEEKEEQKQEYEETGNRRRRIVFISDTHDKHHSVTLPSADLLIHCGDILQNYGYFGSYEGTKKRLDDFDKWLSKQTHINHKLVIGGNHDIHLQKHPWIPKHCTLLDGKTIHNINGIKVFGSPYSPQGVTKNNAFQQEEIGKDHIRTLISQQQPNSSNNDDDYDTKQEIDSVLDILVTHARCNEFEDAAIRSKARVWAHGHYHNQYGIDTIKRSKYSSSSQKNGQAVYCINAATCTMTYEPINPPVVLDIIPNSF